MKINTKDIGRNDMKRNEISTANEAFYYGFSGKKTMDMQVNIKVDHEVNVNALDRAVKNIVFRYPHLRKKLIVDQENIFYVENDKIPEVYRWDTENCLLGTKETGYFLFRVMYRQDEIILSIHHGVTDGKGIIEIIKALLSDYVRYRNGQEADKLIELEDALKIEDIYEKYGDMKQTPVYIYQNKGAFAIPEDYYSNDEVFCKKFKIKCSIKDLLKVSKRSQSTPVPVLAVIISEAIQSLYDVGEKAIIGYVPVNLRPIFHSETLSNASIAIALPYDSRLNGKDMDLKCTILRGIMDLQIQKENFVYRMGKQVEMGRKRKEMKIPAEMKQKIYVDKLTKSSQSLYTYLLTYIGKVGFLEEVEQAVKEISFNLPAYLIPLTICASADENTMILNCTQNFKTDIVIKKIVEVMEEKKIYASYEDLGEMRTEALEFEKLPHLKAENGNL